MNSWWSTTLSTAHVPTHKRSCIHTLTHIYSHLLTSTHIYSHLFTSTHRVRPQNSREQIDMCRVCTFCTPDQPHIILGKDKAFTYDYVFDTATEQVDLYSDCVDDLVEG